MSVYEYPLAQIGNTEVKITDDCTKIKIIDADGYVSYTLTINIEPHKNYYRYDIKSVKFEKVKA